MQLADQKHCFLEDVLRVPSSEVPLWVAYYEWQEEERKKAERKAKTKR